MGDGRSEELPPQIPTYKVIVVGDSGVGKTCLTFRFCNGHFPSADTEATIGVDFREKTIKDTLDGKTGEGIKLHLWDTAGQERFRKSMVAHYYRNVSAVVLVYDVTNEQSFNSLSKWVSECANHGLTPEDVPMIVVGNKCDSGMEAKLAVSTYKAQRFADFHKMPLFETSAKDDDKAYHVEAIFVTLAHKIKKRNTKSSFVDSTKGKTKAVVYNVKDVNGEVERKCFFC